MDFNTWTNEYGDVIMRLDCPEHLRYSVYAGDTYRALYKGTNKDGKDFASLKSAETWLNKFRKAKKWIATRE